MSASTRSGVASRAKMSSFGNQRERVDVQKRLRAACTTFRALRSEWADARLETKDALTIMANAALELENVHLIKLPRTLASDELREALKLRREEALVKARDAVIECASHVANIRADFEKLADTDRYVAMGSDCGLSYPDDGPVFKTLTFKEFRRAFESVNSMYVEDIKSKEELLEKISDADAMTKMNRDMYLAIISLWILDPYLNVEAVDEFDELILHAELGY